MAHAINQQTNAKASPFLDALLLLIFVTASFDTLLNLKISGFSVRICNLLMGVFILIMLTFVLLQKRKFTIQLLGFWSFLAWFLLLIVFVQNSILISRGIGYVFWLLLFALFILALKLYVQTQAHFQNILILYFRCFTIIGFLGVLQFFLTIAGIPFMVEYFFMSGIPRIHGFSYEPSYFSTYLIIPWVFHFYLFFSPYQEFKRKTWNQLTLPLLTIIILLSVSRMGILLMLLLMALHLLRIITHIGLRNKTDKRSLNYLIVMLACALISVIIITIKSKTFISLLEGLPVFSRYAHSAAVRWDDLINTWKVFVNSPWIGYSLGGVAPAIAQLKGHQIITQDIVKNTEGMCIFLEVLAASGIIGFLFFILFIRKLLISAKLLKKRIRESNLNYHIQQINLHKLLVGALIFQLLLLCLNQNILRNYLWIHIAMVNLSFFILKREIMASTNTGHA
jgi:hypothetical protein